MSLVCRISSSVALTTRGSLNRSLVVLNKGTLNRSNNGVFSSIWHGAENIGATYLSSFRTMRYAVGNIGTMYARASTRRPYLVSALTACGILTLADLSSQACEAKYTRKTQGSGGQNKMWDYRRTLALSIFGFLYYGGPCKALYFAYERVFTHAIQKMAFDAAIHTPFFLVPVFYLVTCPIKGKSFEETLKQLKAEWFESALGSVGFWGPTCLVNFAFVPLHSRMLVISVMSFFHKTWLSWMSNRKQSMKEMKMTTEPVAADAKMMLPADKMTDGLIPPTTITVTLQPISDRKSVSVVLPQGVNMDALPAIWKREGAGHPVPIVTAQ